MQAQFQRDRLSVVSLHIVLAISYLPGLWQNHLPSVICGQGQIKWHGVVPAGSVVPTNYYGQRTGLWFTLVVVVAFNDNGT